MALGLTPKQIVESGKHPLLKIHVEWSRVTLEQISSVQNGYAFKSKFFSKDDGMPLIRIRDIARKKTENLYTGEYAEEYVVETNDILVGMDGDFNVSKWPGNKGLLNQRVCRLILHSKYYAKGFFFYCLQPYLDAINAETSAVTVKHLSSKTIKSIPLPLPPLPEQRAIVAKLEQLFSELEDGVANLQKAQRQLKVYRQAVLKKAFEGDWKLIELEEISEAVGGYAFRSKSFLEEGKYQVIRIGNVRPSKIRREVSPVFLNEVEERVKKRYRLQRGDVVISLTGTRKKRDYGFTALIKDDDLLLNQRLACLRFEKAYDPKFFMYFSWSEPFKQQFFGSETGNTGQGNVSMKSIKKTLVPMPSLEEQHQIVQEIESRLSVCDQLEQDIEANLKRAERLRQSLLQKAFAGELLTEAELRACRAEPDWEPAEKLLNRIKGAVI